MSQGYDILFTYSLKEILSYEEIYDAIGKIIDKINQSADTKGADKDVTAEQ